MIRDTFKDKIYFEKYIENQQERKKKYIDRINSLPNPEEGFYKSSTTLDLFSRNVFIAKYSAGYPIKDMYDDYIEMLKWFETTYSSISTYVQLVWMLSIGILLEVEEADFNRLITLVDQDNPDDRLIDFLIAFQRKAWHSRATSFKFPQPYGNLDSIITGESRNAVSELKIYLDKRWYKGHASAGWYDSHKGKRDTYIGYWSFESGAIVKILSLDDTILQDQPYYPYDMVHWQEQES